MKSALKLTLTVGALIVASSAWAIDRTPEQEMACTGDAFRFCASEIPNEERILACMIRQKAQLSRECRAVLDQAEPDTEPAPKPRGKPRRPARSMSVE